MRISLIPQKNFLFGIALNLLLVHYNLHQLPSEKQFKKGHYELNIYLPVLFTETVNTRSTVEKVLFLLLEADIGV